MTTETPAAPLIYARIAAVMADVEVIGKDRSNTAQGYKFRGIDDAYNALHGPLAKHKVFYTSQVLRQENSTVPTKSGGVQQHSRPTVRYTFYTEDGSFVTTESIGEAMDSGDKAEGKAQSYALKVALMQLFCIPTEEPKDTEYDTHERAAVTLAQAVGDVVLASTSEEVDSLWAAYAGFHEVEAFRKVVGGKKKQLAPAA